MSHLARSLARGGAARRLFRRAISSGIYLGSDAQNKIRQNLVVVGRPWEFEQLGERNQRRSQLAATSTYIIHRLQQGY